MGLACRALGDEDSARLEFAAARASFVRLDVAPARDAYELTARELEPVFGQAARARGAARA